MKPLLFLIILLLATESGYSAEQTMIQALIGREFSIADDWAGQELAFRRKGDNIVAVWRILGSGVPVASETEYPVEVISSRKCTVEVSTRSQNRSKITICLGEGNEVKAYLNGIRILIQEIELRKLPKPTSTN